MLQIVIPRALLTEIESHAQEEVPRECCGLLAGRGGQIVARYPLRNQSADPEREYFATPEDLFVAMRRMRERREELLAIYHSHPRGPAYPSATDLETAFYPEAVYLIVALTPTPEVRCFQISNHTFKEVLLVSE